MLPSIGVPTTAGTGSEAQSYALIADETIAPEDGLRRQQGRVPRRHPRPGADRLAADGGDGRDRHRRPGARHRVVRLHEAQSRVAGIFAGRVAAPGAELRNGPAASPTNLEARAAMQVGSHLAGAAIENAMLGICHSCANPLTAHYGITHGTAIGVLLPHVIRFNAPAAEALYADLASTPAVERRDRRRRCWRDGSTSWWRSPVSRRGSATAGSAKAILHSAGGRGERTVDGASSTRGRSTEDGPARGLQGGLVIVPVRHLRGHGQGDSGQQTAVKTLKQQD